MIRLPPLRPAGESMVACFRQLASAQSSVHNWPGLIILWIGVPRILDEIAIRHFERTISAAFQRGCADGPYAHHRTAQHRNQRSAGGPQNAGADYTHGYEPFSTSPAEFAHLVAAETEKWGKVIRAANIKVE
jgi:hypothetical protein